MPGSPINDVLQMRQQGLSNNQIIQNLQRAGYTNTQIFDAMNQADTKMAVEGIQPGVLQQQPQDLFTQPFNQSEFNQTEQNNQGFHQEDSIYTIEPSYQPHQTFSSAVKTEELIEALIEEKWEELLKDVNKIVEWKNKVEARISEMEIKIENLKDNLSDLNKAVISKVNDYDKHILEIGSDLKAMEKVFSKVLPVFTENVNELSRIANTMKRGIK